MEKMDSGMSSYRTNLVTWKQEVTYLGHKITAEGLKIDSEKVKAIMEMPKPEDRQAVQRLLGMVNYVQKFAPCLSEITTHLDSYLSQKMISNGILKYMD